MILSTQTFTGASDPQPIDLPTLPSTEARVAFVVWGNADPVYLVQGDSADDPRIPVGPDQGDPAVASSFRLLSAPSHILLSGGESEVYLSIVRV